MTYTPHHVQDPDIGPASNARLAASIPVEFTASPSVAPERDLTDTDVDARIEEMEAHEQLIQEARVLAHQAVGRTAEVVGTPERQVHLEMLAVAEAMEATRSRHLAELLEDVSVSRTMAALLKNLVNKALATNELADITTLRTRPNEVHEDLVTLEAEIGGRHDSLQKMREQDPEIQKHHFFSLPSDRFPDQFDVFLKQWSENPAKNFTLWYKVTPQGIEKFYSMDHQASTPTPAPLVKDATYDEAKRVLEALAETHQNISAHFEKRRAGRHAKLPRHRRQS